MNDVDHDHGSILRPWPAAGSCRRALPIHSCAPARPLGDLAKRPL